MAGKISLVSEYCKGCFLCVEICPKGILRPSRLMNKKGYFIPEIVDADACTGCGLCDRGCPDFALVMKREGVLWSQ